jgi:TolB-like protein/tetratricopeptide (TPR) repeat protein
VATLIAIAGAWLSRDRLWRGASSEELLVVLPFENRGGNPDDEFFSDGITDETIAQLGALDPQRVYVIARTTAMQYKASRKDVIQIGQDLGVDYLLEGSVGRDAARVRITAKLTEVNSQTPLWAETYERNLNDVLMLQRDVAGRIAQSLGGVLSPVLARATRRSPNIAAYDRTLKGRAFRHEATEAGLRQCVAMFEEATALDAEYASAYAGLSDCYRLLGGPGMEVGPPAELLTQARAAADSALEFDPELPEGYAARAMVRFNADWDLAGADRDLARAITLNPSYARAHQYRSEVLTALGRFDEAVSSARRALELDPLSAIASTTLGATLYYAGKYEDAIRQFEQTLAVHPDLTAAHWALGQTYRQIGRHEDAVRELEAAVARGTQSSYMRAWLAHALAASGRRDDAEAIRLDLTAEAGERFVAPFLFGLIASGLGQKDVTLDWLEKVRASKSGWIPFLPVEPAFAWLRGDPRFKQLLTSIKR